jgi:hypothetical protein
MENPTSKDFSFSISWIRAGFLKMIRWILMARIFTSNLVLFKVSAWSYSVLTCREGFDDYCESNVMDAMDDARHDYVSKTEQKHENTMSEAKKWWYYLLQFPEDVQLATKCIKPKGRRR